MKKHFISVLLIGAMVVPSFVACDNKGLDDLTRGWKSWKVPGTRPSKTFRKRS